MSESDEEIYVSSFVCDLKLSHKHPNQKKNTKKIIHVTARYFLSFVKINFIDRKYEETERWWLQYELEKYLSENNISAKDIFYQTYNPKKSIGDLICKICDPSSFK